MYAGLELALNALRRSKAARASSTCTLVVASLSLAAAGCGVVASEPSGASAQAVVYGEDDRAEPLASQQPDWLREMTEARLLALGALADVSFAGSGAIALSGPTLQDRYDLCDGEAFSDQPSFAVCSGMRLSSRHVLTAAHCARVSPLGEQVGVGRFHYDASGALPALTTRDLHTFTAVVARDDYWDFAWLELSEPQPVLGDVNIGSVSAGAAIVSVNHGAGLPAKVSSSRAATVDPTSLSSTLDAFGGASGGPVFSSSGVLLAILTSGAPDYETTPTGCRRAARREDTADAAAERAVRADFAVDALCGEVFDPELCPTVVRSAGCTVSAARTKTPRTLLVGVAALALLLLCRVRRRDP